MKKILLIQTIIITTLFSTSLDNCIHLLNRSGFGVQNVTLDKCMETKNYEKAVASMLYAPAAHVQYRTQIIKPNKKPKNMTPEERKAFRKMRKTQEIKFKKAYFRQLLQSTNPFHERMVLFWQKHFTTSLKKVKQAKLMSEQQQLFREQALGNFSILLHEIIRDPAMLIYLDNRSSKKSHPNENFARELLELYTLGEGHYSEKDMKELARGLTGYSVDRDFNFKYKKRIHDKGMKVFLGEKGKFDGDDMVDIILSQDRVSEYIVRKLWLEFIDDNPQEMEVKKLAHIFKENDYEIKPLMKALLTSNYFTNPDNRATMIKSPLELIVGTLRSFSYTEFDPKIGVQYSRRMGEDLLDPPNVKGWPGGKQWIDTNRLLTRMVFLSKLTRGEEMKHMHLSHFKSKYIKGSEEEVAAKFLLPLDVYITPGKDVGVTLKTLLKHPLYQLK